MVGQATVFYDTRSTEYEHAVQRVLGNIGFTAKLGVYVRVVEAFVPKIVKELRGKGKTAIWTLAEESPANKILRELGYGFIPLEGVERYQEAGLSGKVYEYSLP